MGIKWFQVKPYPQGEFMKSTLLSYLTLVTLTCSSVTSHAGWFSEKKAAPAANSEQVAQDLAKNYINLSIDEASSSETVATLKTLESQVKDDFKAIETLMAENKTDEALKLAKQSLDDVRAKLGVDPKAKLTENFFININFAPNAVELDQLTEDQKIAVIKTLRNFRGGYFLDILNLSKRTSLIYLKALEVEIKRTGDFTSDNRNKIIKDLATAILLPLPIVDKAGTKIIIFFDDVANEDLSYIFNNELTQYLEKNKELNISSKDFNEYLARLKLSLNLGKQKFIVSANYERARLCIDEDMRTTTHSYYWKESLSVGSCFYNSYKQLNSFQVCNTLVDHIEKQAAQKKIAGDYLEKTKVYHAACSAQYPVQQK